MEDKQQRMKDLTDLLNKAGKAYYQEAREIMTNFEYDKLYDELLELERDTGQILEDSPTAHVGYKILSELPKEAHDQPMLSLNKTKEVGELSEFMGDQEVLVSWKLDGLTIVLTYEDGSLIKAVTRGNGQTGEVITNNAKVFKNIPLDISFTGRLVVRGEAVISYSDFEKINKEIPDIDAKYKNPRNLCSGSVRQLNNKITAKRNVQFFAFSLVESAGADFGNSHEKEMEWLRKQGFDVVEYERANQNNISQIVSRFEEKVRTYDYPSDGLVVLMDDISYGRSLGSTSKFPRDSIAFKWEDEIRTTKLKEIEWSASRTGLINPVAIFEPVELEGSTVSRASVHNISILKSLELGIDDEIQVYKANMIIPQIAENLTRSRNLEIPKICPVCEGDTEIKHVGDVETLYCMNPECQAKKIKSFTHFAGRDGMNIEGLSEATLEKFIGKGYIKEFADLFHLSKYKEEIVEMEGFGEKSYENLISSTEKARNTTLPRLIYSLGIENVGLATAKLVCEAFDYDFSKMRSAQPEEISEVHGVGEVIANTFAEYFKEDKNIKILEHLLSEVTIEEKPESDAEQKLGGKTFVVTGSVELFENRKELKSFIEERGGKVTGSVTSKTDYLINNDNTSASSKNKKAKELEIPILTEEDFMKLAEQGL